MKLQLETIHLSGGTTSFNFFKRKTHSFESYWHYHPELELTYIQYGSGTRIIGDHVESFSDKDLVLIGENLPHNYISSDIPSDRDAVAFVFHFPKAIFSSFPECSNILKLCEAAQHGLQFTNLSNALIRKIENCEDHNALDRLITLFEIFKELIAQPQKQLSSIAFRQGKTAEKFQSRISEVTNFIFNHLAQAISLEDTARFAGMSVNGFCRWFKQSTGFTYVGYLNTLRIEKACQLLLQTDWLIVEIAYKTGFENVTHFNRTFKKIKHMSPKMYRNNSQIIAAHSS